MDAVLYELTDLLHLIKVLCFCDLIFMFRKRQEKRIRYVVSFICMLSLSLWLYYSEGNSITFTSYILVFCIVICLLYDEKILELVFSGLWIFFLTSMLDLMTTEMIYVVFELTNIKNERVEELLAACLSLVFIFVIGKIYSNKYNEGIKRLGIVKLFFFTILAIADTYVVTIIASIVDEKILEDYKLGYLVSVLVLILGILIQLSSVISLIISRDTYKEKEEITQKYLNEQTKHYQYLEQRETNTKKFRHDIKNHMQVLSMMAKNNQYSDFNEYMKEINMQIDRLGNVITVNNGIVDAIVNKYHSEAVQKGINITFKGMLPSACRISPYDLCTIFSNLLSNAIEAAEKSDEKRITLECRYTGDNIIIIAENTFKDEGQFSHSKIVTTKKDVEYHGFGIENIKDAVERHNGMLDINIENTTFSIMIMLEQEADK